MSGDSHLTDSSGDDDVGRREEDGDGGDYCEEGEGDQAEPVDHHRRKLRRSNSSGTWATFPANYVQSDTVSRIYILTE